MAIQIGAKPDSGFDDPIGMLKDCHRRIERFAELLHRVAEQADGRPLMAEEREAVERALGYFRESGPRHNMDEEESLFPRLASAAGEDDRRMMERLEGDHAHASELHASVDWLYTSWITDGVLERVAQQRLLSHTASLRQLYQDHIEIEESVIFPRAVEMLDGDALAAIGNEFSARRR